MHRFAYLQMMEVGRLGDPVTEIGGTGRAFPDTLWTAVLAARDRDAPGFSESLERLVHLYWKPVYWAIRVRWGKSNEEAKDLTQDFFASFLEKDRMKGVGPERGRFRSYVQAVLRNYLVNVHEAGKALKRGGGARLVPLEAAEDDPLVREKGLGPDEAFERAWALSIFRDVAKELGVRYRASGKESWFQVFEKHDLAETPPSYEALARELGISEDDVDNRLRHARKAFREALRARVRETLMDEADLESELRHLARALSAP